MFNNNIFLLIIYLFLVISLMFVVLIYNPIISLLFLILSFIFVSILVLFFNCELLGFFFLIVYVGAIAVLFLFAIMSIDIKFSSMSKILISNFILLYLLIFMALILNLLIKKTNFFLLFNSSNFMIPIYFINWKHILFFSADINSYNLILYTYFVLQFLVTGFILLLILVGIVFMVNSYLNENFRYQNNFKQISINSAFFL